MRISVNVKREHAACPGWLSTATAGSHSHPDTEVRTAVLQIPNLAASNKVAHSKQ